MFKKTLAGLAIAAVAIMTMQGNAQAGSHKKLLRFGFAHRTYNIWHGYEGRYSGCHRYKRNAIRTGSRYWWKRYRICKYDRYGDLY